MESGTPRGVTEPLAVELLWYVFIFAISLPPPPPPPLGSPLLGGPLGLT